MNVARNQYLPWSRLDEYAFNRFLRCAPPSQPLACFRCHMSGHFAADCQSLKSRDKVSHLGQSMSTKPIPSTASRPFVQNSPFIKPLAGISTPTIAVTKTAAGPTSAIDAAALTQQQIAQALNNNFNPLPTFSKTPVNANLLRKELTAYPDQSFVDNLIISFEHGFSIGYSGPEFCNIAPNLQSASSNPTAIFNCISEELSRNGCRALLPAHHCQTFVRHPSVWFPRKTAINFV